MFASAPLTQTRSCACFADEGFRAIWNAGSRRMIFRQFGPAENFSTAADKRPRTPPTRKASSARPSDQDEMIFARSNWRILSNWRNSSEHRVHLNRCLDDSGQATAAERHSCAPLLGDWALETLTISESRRCFMLAVELRINAWIDRARSANPDASPALTMQSIIDF